MRASASRRTSKLRWRLHSARQRELFFSRAQAQPRLVAMRAAERRAREDAVHGSAMKAARSISGGAACRQWRWPRSIAVRRPRFPESFSSLISAEIGISLANRSPRMRTPFSRGHFSLVARLAEEGDKVARGILAVAAESLAGLAAAVAGRARLARSRRPGWRKLAGRMAARNISTPRLTRRLKKGCSASQQRAGGDVSSRGCGAHGRASSAAPRAMPPEPALTHRARPIGFRRRIENSGARS